MYVEATLKKIMPGILCKILEKSWNLWVQKSGNPVAGELFTKTNHKSIDLHYKFNILSIFFVPLFPVTYNMIQQNKASSWTYIQMEAFKGQLRCR